MRPRSVAVVLLSALGDAVHTLPIVASLRRAWPETHISWVIQPPARALVEGHPDVDEFLTFRRERGAAGLLEFRRGLRGRRFDLVIDLQVYLKAGLLTGLLRAPVKLGFDRVRTRDLNWLFTTHRIPPHAPGHVQDQYFEFLDFLGVPVRRRWELALRESERAAGRDFFGRLGAPALAVVVSSSRREKDWIPDRYARVLEVAHADLGLRPVLVGGRSPGEDRMAARVLALTRVEVLDARADDVRRLVWLLNGSAVLLSPDTGPLHIAVALGTPSVGLYGYTDPKRVGPYERFRELTVDRYSRPGESEPSAELRPGNMARIGAEEVAAKLERALRTARVQAD